MGLSTTASFTWTPSTKPDLSHISFKSSHSICICSRVYQTNLKYESRTELITTDLLHNVDTKKVAFNILWSRSGPHLSSLLSLSSLLLAYILDLLALLGCRVPGALVAKLAKCRIGIGILSLQHVSQPGLKVFLCLYIIAGMCVVSLVVQELARTTLCHWQTRGLFRGMIIHSIEQTRGHFVTFKRHLSIIDLLYAAKDSYWNSVLFWISSRLVFDDYYRVGELQTKLLPVLNLQFFPFPFPFQLRQIVGYKWKL